MVTEAIAISGADSGRLNTAEAIKPEREIRINERMNPIAVSNIRPAFIIS